MNYLRKERNQYLILLFFFTTIAVISDRLFISQYFFAISPLMLLMIKKDFRIKLFKPIGISLLSLLAGLLIFSLIRTGKSIHIIGTGYKMLNFENLSASWDGFRHFMNYWIIQKVPENIILLLMLAGWILSGVFLIKYARETIASDAASSYLPERYLVLVFFTYIPATLFTPVINGAFISPSLIRFNIMAFFIGLLLFSVILMSWKYLKEAVEGLLKYLLGALSVVAVIFMVSKMIQPDFRDGLHNYFNFYPENAKILDELKDTHELKYGVGNYWYAKYCTTFSKNNNRLYTVFGHTLRPFYHSTNEKWYHDGGKGEYADPVFNYTMRKTETDSEVLIETFKGKLDTLYLDPDSSFVIIKLPEFKIDRETRNIILME
ncbi:hypothetical protein ACFLT1_00295 [Bacteroidota bacterium]